MFSSDLGLFVPKFDWVKSGDRLKQLAIRDRQETAKTG